MNLPPNGNDFALVNQVVNGSVSFVNAKEKRETITREQFLSDWRSIAVVINAVKPNKENIVKSSISFSQMQRILTGLAIFSLISFLILEQLASPIQILFSFLQIIGIGISILLLMLEVNKDSQTAKQFCQATKTVNCTAVLQSKGARIGMVSWSEIGFAYFTGSFLFQLLVAQNHAASQLLWFLSFASLPYVLYSGYYQKMIVKQWCKLCLLVQGIIFLQGSISLYLLLQNGLHTVNPTYFLGLTALLLLPVTIWQWLKPQFKLASTSEDWQYGFLRLQNNPNVFEAMLAKEPTAPEGYQNVSLQFGNPNASNSIIKVCNPFCDPCAKVQPVLEEVMQNENVQMHLIFKASNEVNDRRGAVARHFIDLYHNDKTISAEAIHWWYAEKDKNIEELRVKYPIRNRNEENIKTQIKGMSLWNEKANISHTPTIFINQHKMPDTHNVEYLKNYFKQ